MTYPNQGAELECEVTFRRSMGVSEDQPAVKIRTIRGCSQAELEAASWPESLDYYREKIELVAINGQAIERRRIWSHFTLWCD